jgi:hypothetical protein
VTEPKPDLVECYSGYTYAQEPRAVVWRGRRFPVVSIERRWRTPEGPGFRVETEAGGPFELHYSEPEDAWAIQPLAEFDQEAIEPTHRDEGKQGGENRNPHRNYQKDKEVREGK